VVFIEAPWSVEDLQAIGAAFDSPLLYGMGGSGTSPYLSADELATLGPYRLMIFPNFVLRATLAAARQVLQTVYATGSAASLADAGFSWVEKQELARLDEWQAIERRYGVEDAALTKLQDGVRDVRS